MTADTQQSILPGDLVSTDWLSDHLDAPSLRIVDIRGYVKTTDLGDGAQAAEYVGAGDEFAAAHLPGATFVDWTSDIVDPGQPVKAQLATPDQFATAMSVRGIGDATDVVVVDHTGGNFATRLWWALRYYGHDRVAVLDGGHNKWVREGRPVTTEVRPPVPVPFTPQPQPGLIADAATVIAAMNDGSTVIADARDAGQYTGAVRRGSRGGRVPGAVHLPAKALINADGTWKPLEEQREIIAAGGVRQDQPVIAYCNGGVTATALLFALHRTGHARFANYDGSWNEWGERHDLPVDQG